jgi:hypothetical protein
MGHAYNNGLHTSSKGMTYEALRVTGLNNGGTPTIAEDCKGGLFTSVTQAVNGTVVLQLSKPYPPKLVVAHAQVAVSGPTVAYRHARPGKAGYDATNGTLTVYISDATPAAQPLAAADDELHILVSHNRYTR